MLEGLKRHWAILRESVRQDREEQTSKAAALDPAFLPATLEILETPPNPLGRGILWAVTGFITLALAWSIIGKVDVVASAQGKVVPKGLVKVVQPSDYGVIRAIHVSEGDRVVAGQPLVELNPTASSAELEQARQALSAAEVDRARARALVDHAQGRTARFIAPDGVRGDALGTQVSLVQARVRGNQTTIGGLVQDRAQRAADLGMIDAEIAKLEEQLPLVTEQLEGLERLQAQGYAPRLRVSEVRERVVGMRQDLAIRRQERRKAMAAVASVGEQIDRTRSEFAGEALDALTEAENARSLRAEELAKAMDKASLTVLSAPEAGVIQQLQIHTIGGVVKPADPLMVLVPSGGNLVVEVMVLNSDAGFVRPGQRVEIKLEAYAFTRYGVIDGEIERISSDAVQDENLGLVYPARVRLDRNWIRVDGVRRSLAPGLAATVEIKTGRRRIIEYLLSPLLRRVKEAGRER
jgi:hemolysin D